MEDKKRPVTASTMTHRLVISERESVSVDGVSNVESFDDEQVVLQTSAGLLVVKGRDLHIRQLNLEEGSLSIEGYVYALDYADEGGPRKAGGFLSRLFK